MSTYGPSSSFSSVILPQKTYSADAGTSTPLGSCVNLSGLSYNFSCSAAAMVNSSIFSSNDIAAANKTTGSGAFTTAMSTVSPLALAVLIIVRK